MNTMQQVHEALEESRRFIIAEMDCDTPEFRVAEAVYRAVDLLSSHVNSQQTEINQLTAKRSVELPRENSEHAVGRRIAREDFAAIKARLVGQCAAEGYVLELARLLDVNVDPRHADKNYAMFRGLLDQLQELYALVKGECPSLLNEDSGGSAQLDMNIRAAIAKAAGREGAA